MTEEQILTKPEDLYVDPSLKEMVEVGMFYGRKKSKTHPRMKQFILQNRNGIEIINLNKTKEMLDRALAFLTETAKNGRSFLFVGTQPSAAALEPVAREFKFPFVRTRWLGGTLTNFKVVSGRIDYFKKLRSDLAAGAFEKYTKKERLEIEREIKRLNELLSGLETLLALPGALVVIDPVMHLAAVREANKLHIPVAAFVNTDTDPDLIQYPVIGNTKARLAVSWFLEKAKAAIEAGLQFRAAQSKIKEEEATASSQEGGVSGGGA